ncbi:unnamed protein product [Schistocephalus solidus]|uniref:Uncharacterized protein n=1 Tax=Schistocephalus solidus TaxID=70667 RepID=A0A183TQB8_SCHSO|nr:unnamed protein product [Schistocephalus solidus]
MMSAHPAANFSERGRLAPSRTNWTAQADALLRSCASAVVKAAGPLALRAVARELQKDEPLFALSGQLSPAGPTSPIPLTAPICLTDQVQCCRNSLFHSAVKLLTKSPGQALASGDLLSLALDLLIREEHLPEAAPRLDAYAHSAFPRCLRPRMSRRPTEAARPTSTSLSSSFILIPNTYLYIGH